jgi:23S rRNA (adenine-N6)-dimethyltransferase
LLLESSTPRAAPKGCARHLFRIKHLAGIQSSRVRGDGQLQCGYVYGKRKCDLYDSSDGHSIYGGITAMIRKRILLAQNFIRDPGLVGAIVAGSSITKSDLVYEIGPGEGIITQELAAVARQVIAIEKDPTLVRNLKSRFSGVGNVEIQEGDFIRFEIRYDDYKVFSNIPFNITSDIVRKLINAKNPPSDAYLVLQEAAAGKFAGIPGETEFSVLAKPWFDITIVRRFLRTDFEPVPSVEVALLRIAKREQALVTKDNAATYRRFVKFGFEAWKKDLGKAYDKIFTYEQWKRISRELGFKMDVKPTQLTFTQWLGTFKRFLEIVPESKRVPFLK